MSQQESRSQPPWLAVFTVVLAVLAALASNRAMVAWLQSTLAARPWMLQPHGSAPADAAVVLGYALFRCANSCLHAAAGPLFEL